MKLSDDMIFKLAYRVKREEYNYCPIAYRKALLTMLRELGYDEETVYKFDDEFTKVNRGPYTWSSEIQKEVDKFLGKQ